MICIPCPCGQEHELTDSLRMDIERGQACLPPVVTIRVPRGLLRVPRIYAACHGIRKEEMVRLQRCGAPAPGNLP